MALPRPVIRWLPADADAEAGEIFRRARLDPDSGASLMDVANALFGPGGVKFIQGYARISTFKWRGWFIWIRAGLPYLVRNRALGHELSESHLWSLYYDNHPDIEERANAIADALLVRRGLLRKFLQAYGLALQPLADIFRVDQRTIALRVGEVTGHPIALVSPAGIEIRGEPWGWPDAKTLFRVASGELSAPVDIIPLTDARRHFLVMARR